MLLIVAVCYFATAFNAVDSDLIEPWVFQNAFSLTYLVTQEDKQAFIFTSIYVIYYCLRTTVRFPLAMCARVTTGHLIVLPQLRTWRPWNARWTGGHRSKPPHILPTESTATTTITTTTISRSGGRTPKPINPVLASIALAVQRIYGSVDNPYTSTITFLMLTWTMHKISMFDRSMRMYAPLLGHASFPLSPQAPAEMGSVPFRWAGICDIVLDCFMVSTFLYAGVVVQVFASLGGSILPWPDNMSWSGRAGVLAPRRFHSPIA